MRVLVLEDEPLIQMAMVQILEEAGHRVTTTETAEGAAAINRVDPHDVAILDLNLGAGRRDGVDAALEIMRDQPTTRIIFQTAHADPLNFKRMWTVCPEAILDKPINEAALLKAVAGQIVEAA